MLAFAISNIFLFLSWVVMAAFIYIQGKWMIPRRISREYDLKQKLFDEYMRGQFNRNERIYEMQQGSLALERQQLYDDVEKARQEVMDHIDEVHGIPPNSDHSQHHHDVRAEVLGGRMVPIRGYMESETVRDALGRFVVAGDDESFTNLETAITMARALKE